MKHLLYFLIGVMALFLLSCVRTSFDINETNIVPDEFAFFGDSACYIKYAEKINGFDVKIKVCPFTSKDSALIGVADIAFLHGDTVMMVFHNPYFRLSGINKESVKNGEVYVADYNLPIHDHPDVICLREYHELPFFFLDVDFDNFPELILNYSRQAQRWCNAYVVYGADKCFLGYDYLYDSTRRIAAYDDLDDCTKINYAKEEISNYILGGMGLSELSIYKKIDGNIRLYCIEDYDSLGHILARRQLIKTDTVTTYFNGREHLFH